MPNCCRDHNIRVRREGSCNCYCHHPVLKDIMFTQPAADIPRCFNCNSITTDDGHCFDCGQQTFIRN